MSVVTITINGELVSANSEQTLLAVLREHNVPIPTLCHLDGLSDRGGCRLCLVEIEGSPKLQAACVTPVQEELYRDVFVEEWGPYTGSTQPEMLGGAPNVPTTRTIDQNGELS